MNTTQINYKAHEVRDSKRSFDPWFLAIGKLQTKVLRCLPGQRDRGVLLQCGTQDNIRYNTLDAPSLESQDSYFKNRVVLGSQNHTLFNTFNVFVVLYFSLERQTRTPPPSLTLPFYTTIQLLRTLHIPRIESRTYQSLTLILRWIQHRRSHHPRRDCIYQRHEWSHFLENPIRYTSRITASMICVSDSR